MLSVYPSLHPARNRDVPILPGRYISRYGSKNGSPTRDSTEVAKMKRIPQPNYSLSMAVPENALRVTW